MTDINFDSENLKVDYLSFNLQFNNPEQIQKIADFSAHTLPLPNYFVGSVK